MVEGFPAKPNMKSRTRPLIKKNAKARLISLIKYFFKTLSSADDRLAGEERRVIGFL
tara:strand:+ start:629 stop:799 length:171 start_codon:yes stop_codon:yes gene_type:complete